MPRERSTPVRRIGRRLGGRPAGRTLAGGRLNSALDGFDLRPYVGGVRRKRRRGGYAEHVVDQAVLPRAVRVEIQVGAFGVTDDLPERLPRAFREDAVDLG